MHLLLFSGFLGSGKTTLAVQVAQAVVERGKRVAILVNEIGEAGIDNQLMRQLDLNVWELLNGCICCTLSADLVSTLQKLDTDYAPDLVVLEPSGAADPHSVLHAIPYYRGRPLESQRFVAILDPLRLPVLIEVMTPLIHSQIQNADFILIGKSDLAQPADLETARQIAHRHNSQADVVCANLTAGLTPELLSQIVPWLN